MNNAGNVTEDGQQDIQPESPAQPHLQKYAQRGKQDGDQNTQEIHVNSCLLIKRAGAAPSATAAYMDSLSCGIKKSKRRRQGGRTHACYLLCSTVEPACLRGHIP